MLQAIIFDFDGLMLETEGADFYSWQECYQLYGASLDLATWLPYIGMGSSSITFDIYAHLEEQAGMPINRDEIRSRRCARYTELVAQQALLPGVEKLIASARSRGLRLAVASSSNREWVCGHLEQRKLREYFEVVVCEDDVRYTKPDPELYLTALTKLGIKAEEAMALEDSPNGVLAAKRAGLFCIAVPNPLTCHMTYEEADLRLPSLVEIRLEDWLAAPWHNSKKEEAKKHDNG